MKYLLKTVETYRVATEDEAKKLIEEAKRDRNFTLVKYLSEMREQKAKGEVIDSWYRVTLTKAFTNEKEPDTTVTVNYKAYAGVFPNPVADDDDAEDEE
jgi:hypothetical protein